MSSGIPMQQPINAAMSPTIIVTPPIIPRAMQKQAQPPAMGGGGIQAKSIFHGRESKWNIQSDFELVD